jgi:ABC-type Mn2+/Zn2+ transport system ATPase subunit
MVAINNATCPKVLLLEEPSHGLSTESIATVLEILTLLPIQGYAVCIIEHNQNFYQQLLDNSQFSILNSQFSILNSQFSILNSQFSILNSQFSILNSQFSSKSYHMNEGQLLTDEKYQ